MCDFCPLVSITVLTYNDAEYIVQTLDSIKNQTYQNIELIVSDDCSTDDTVERCGRWLEQNRSRFIDVQLLTVEKNTGVTYNITRAQKAAHGVWIKDLGGDDLLVPNCIEKFVEYIQCNTFVSFVQCRIAQIDQRGNPVSLYIKKNIPYFWNKTTSSYQQHQILLRVNPIETLGLFKKKSMLEDVGYYDLDFPMQEDMSFIMNTISQGYKVWLLDECLVQRRMHSGSLSGLSDEKLISRNDIVRIEVNKKYFKPYLGWFERGLMSMKDKINSFFYHTPWLNKKNALTKLIKRILQSPYTIVRHIKLRQLIK